jgi:hypothetical protein
VAVSVITFIFRAYLIDQSMDHLAGTLKRGGVKDLLAFFPPNKREGKILEEHFRKEGMPQVADWWAKKQYAVVKEGVIKELSEMREREDTTDQVTLLISSIVCLYLNSFRSLPLLKLVRKSHQSQRMNGSNASGRVSWVLSTGVQGQIRSKVLRFVKSR